MKRFLYMGFLLGLAACGPAPDKIGKLDLVKWREDQSGCQNIRAGQINDFKAVQQTEIKGKSANEIGALLGVPDRQQLAERNQKYYIYLIGRGPHCTDRTNLADSPTVAIRFSAMGIATEVTYQTGMP
ncbi:MAG: hypothetical protein H7Z72_15010 [Bacteroidetes bacterium]|nr:hypothetical protein [Fibrella sp.]